MRGLTIRESGPNEAEALLRVQRDACVAGFPHIFPPDEYPFPSDEVLERWKAFAGRIFVAEDDGEIVGVAGIGDCWLNGFYVMPDHWGSGLALQLHDTAVAAIRESGCDQAHLWVLEENHRARRFYERHGWKLNEETRVVPYPPHPLDVGYTLDLR